MRQEKGGRRDGPAKGSAMAEKVIHKPPPQREHRTDTLSPRAIGLAIVCAIALAVLTPYVEIVLWATQIGAFAPPAGAFLILVVLVLGVNPVLARIRPKLAFTRKELLTAYI